MERESFEDQATAELLNKHFISIKVLILALDQQLPLSCFVAKDCQQMPAGSNASKWPQADRQSHARHAMRPTSS
jgi:hypothetical protein